MADSMPDCCNLRRKDSQNFVSRSMSQILLTEQEAVFVIGQVSANLLYPCFVWINRATSKMNTTRFQFHSEQQIKGDQSTFGPNFDRCEIDGCQNIPMGLDKRFPRRILFSIPRWFDTMLFQDIANRLIRYFVTQICERTLNTIVAPIRILFCKAKNQIDNFLRSAWPSNAFSRFLE